MDANALSQKEFNEILKVLNTPKFLDRDFLYEIYDAVINGINDLMHTVPQNKYVPVNHVVVTLYILSEYIFSIEGKTKEQIKHLQEDEDLSSALASICCDKYFTNEQLNYESPVYLNKFNPQISTLNLYLNFNLTTIEKISTKSRESEIFKKMLSKSFSLGKCILDQLLNGFETEAFSTWRTLHESECILFCLAKYGKPVIDKYFIHMRYAIAYRHLIPIEESDKCFEEIKSIMKSHDLKSKDMKKFIEYGYLYGINEFDDLKLKLNFRDGVQKAAGLSQYSSVYEMSSEIAHSSALLLLSESGYFTKLTLLNLYESFFRLEAVFDSFLKTSVRKQEYEGYLMVKSVYRNQLSLIYAREKEKFLGEYAPKNFS